MENLYRNKEWLHQKYINEKLSTREIGKICECSNVTIRYWLNTHKIAMRTIAEARTGLKQKKVPLDIRFWEKVDKNGLNGCWLWTAGCFSNGYGGFEIDGKNKRAHIISWEIINGPVPKGYVLHHKCGVKNCVNPNHLLLMTDFEHLSLHNQGENHHNASLLQFG